MFANMFRTPKAACPYCYDSIRLDQVAFACSGRAAAGRTPCPEVPDARQVQFFQNSTPMRPVLSIGTSATGEPADVLGKDSAQCPQCLAPTSIRVCPRCHSRLPRSLDGESPLFGLVGVRNSGKTVMLSVMHHELTKTVGRRFDASIDTPGGSQGLAGQLIRARERMVNGSGELPGQTDASVKNQQPAVYEWTFTRRGKKASTIFSLYDNAGENVASQDRALDQHYLSASDGIILLLDPFSFDENKSAGGQQGSTDAPGPEDVVDAITYVLQEAHNVKQGKLIQQPLAVVVSKMDAFFDDMPENHPLRRPSSREPYFDETESVSIHDHMSALVAEWGGDGLLRKLRENYANYRLFGASALGFQPQNTADGRQTVDGRGVQPHRVAEPLLWLMADRGFIETRKG